MKLGEYFECEFEPCGPDRGGIIVHCRDASVLAALSGPFEPTSQPPSVFQGTFRLLVYGQDQEKREVSVIQNELEILISSCVLLEEYPRCIIEARVYVMQPGSCLVAACINAVSMLLQVSGIHTRGVLVGASGDSGTRAYLLRGGKKLLWFSLASSTGIPGSYDPDLPDMEIEQKDLPDMEADNVSGHKGTYSASIEGIQERMQFAIKQAHVQGHRMQIKRGWGIGRMP